MKVLHDMGKVALKLRDPTRVLNLIPHAERYNDDIVLVPHQLEVAKVLRNIGIEVPAPIETTYNWPGRFTPFEHQRKASAFMTMHNRCFVLLDMGLGKTNAALWAADYLMNEGLVRKVLVLTTLSCLQPTWFKEIFQNLMHRTAVVVHGTKAQRIEMLQQDVDFYLLNHHGLPVVIEQLKKMDDIDLVIVDEAAAFRNYGTDLYKLFTKYLKPEQRLWMLTGQPCPNGPTDAWALAKLVSPERVPSFFTKWKESTMVRITDYKWVAKPDAKAKMHAALQPSIMYRKEDCLDLPPVTYLSRHAELTKLQVEWYERMKKALVVHLQSHQVTAVNAAVLMGKLLQICAGAVKADDGTYLGLDVSHKLAVLEEVIEEAAAKTIVFVPYTGALNTVAAHLSKNYTVEVIDGSTSMTKRSDIVMRFERDKDPRILVAHPKTASHGLNLIAADTMVWFSPIHSLDVYIQACERMARPGQKRSMRIISIESTPLERGVYAALERKESANEEFLRLFRMEMAGSLEVA